MSECAINAWPVAACLIAFMVLAGVLAWRFFDLVEKA